MCGGRFWPKNNVFEIRRQEVQSQERSCTHFLVDIHSLPYTVSTICLHSKYFTSQFKLERALRNSPIIRFAHIWPQIRSLQNPADYSIGEKLHWRISRFCLHSCVMFVVKTKLPAMSIHLR